MSARALTDMLSSKKSTSGVPRASPKSDELLACGCKKRLGCGCRKKKPSQADLTFVFQDVALPTLQAPRPKPQAKPRRTSTKTVHRRPPKDESSEEEHIEHPCPKKPHKPHKPCDKGCEPDWCESSEPEDRCVFLNGYMKKALQLTIKTLRVAVLNDNEPYAQFVQGSGWTGFDIDLLTRMISNIPCIKRIAVTGFDTEDDALDAVRLGNYDIYVNSNSSVTQFNLLRDLAALITNQNCVPNEGYVYYTDRIVGSIPGVDFTLPTGYPTAEGYTPTQSIIESCSEEGPDDLPEFLRCLDSYNSSNPGAVYFIGEGGNSPSNQVIEALGLNTVGEDVVAPPTAEQLASPTLLAEWLNEATIALSTLLDPNSGTTAQPPLVPSVFLLVLPTTTGTYAAQSVANNLYRVSNPYPLSLIGYDLGWHFSKHHDVLGQWLQATFDDAVKVGVYDELVDQYFSTVGTVTTNCRTCSVSPNAPPALYSIRYGFIPRWGLYNSYLPPVCCTEDLVPPTVATTPLAPVAPCQPPASTPTIPPIVDPVWPDAGDGGNGGDGGDDDN